MSTSNKSFLVEPPDIDAVRDGTPVDYIADACDPFRETYGAHFSVSIDLLAGEYTYRANVDRDEHLPVTREAFRDLTQLMIAGELRGIRKLLEGTGKLDGVDGVLERMLKVLEVRR